MIFSFILQRSSEKAMKILPFRKLSVLLNVTLILVFFLSSLGSADIGNTDGSSTINQTTDTDGDGLNDDLEDTLGTNKTNKFGDKDKDGLYDFEEYLDLYGTPDNTGDSPKYNYNNSTSYDGDNGPILDIYHHFNLSSNKTNYLRDQNFTEANGGFTDYLLWNVSFTGPLAGGSDDGSVSYNRNTMSSVSFTGWRSGGSTKGAVSYNYNTMTSVNFTNQYCGGSLDNSVSYSDNTMTDVIFADFRSGGSAKNDGDSVSYSDNTMTNVSFTGEGSGGGFRGFVSYSDNTMTDVSFTGERSGGSSNGNVTYRKNTISNILLSGKDACSSSRGDSIYTDNVIVNDSYDTDGDGLGDGYERFEGGTDPISAEPKPSLNAIGTLSSFTLLTALGLFTSFGLALVVYHVRGRKL